VKPLLPQDRDIGFTMRRCAAASASGIGVDGDVPNILAALLGLFAVPGLDLASDLVRVR
jgi:hypothetical protein